MDHTQAVKSSIPERYLLGELTLAERDEFETHYFDCPLCADDVQSGAVFIDNARAVLRQEEPGHVQAVFRPTRFGSAFQSAALAAVALMCFTAYQNIVTIPHLRGKDAVRAPEVLPAVSLLAMGSRAESQTVRVPRQRDFELDLEVPGSPEFASYVCEIRDANRSVRFRLPVSAEQAKDEVRLAMPADTLPPGAYEIVVLGIKPGVPAGQKLTAYPINVQYQ